MSTDHPHDPRPTKEQIEQVQRELDKASRPNRHDRRAWYAIQKREAKQLAKGGQADV